VQPVRTTAWKPEVIIIAPVLGVKVKLVRSHVIDSCVVLEVVGHSASEAVNHTIDGDSLTRLALEQTLGIEQGACESM